MTIYQKLLDSKDSFLIGLIDPDKKNDDHFKKQLEYINNGNFCSIFIGGSLIMDSEYNNRVEFIKKNTDLPLIGFPSSSSHINNNFDAVLFLSLISGRNPQYLIGEQVISAPLIYSMKMETISVGYILLDGGVKTSVELVSNTTALPMNNIDLIISHALAAEYLGHKFVYLECGSNSKNSIDLKLLSKVREYLKIPIIVGGGVKKNADIDSIYNAGADFIVVGSMIEEKAANL